MRECPYCKQLWPHPVKPLGLFGGPPPTENYNISDAVQFTVRNVGTLTVLWQFLAGFLAALKKPGQVVGQ